MPRDLNSTPPDTVKSVRLVDIFFLRMVWPAPTGTLYWTTHWDDLYNFDAGFGAVDWAGGDHPAFMPGQIDQGDQSVLSISDITFGNADNSFSDMMKLQPYGCRGIPVDLWKVYFTEALPHTPDGGAISLFSGTLDRAEIGDDVRVSLIAFNRPLSSPFPLRRYSLSWGFKYIPPPNLKFNFGASGEVSLPTSKGPVVTPPVGGGGAPPPGPIGGGGSNPTGRMAVVRGPSRGRPPTATNSGPSRPDPRTVTR